MTQRKAAVEKTRQRILVAARKALLAKDFSGFTMEVVARAADVSRLTVYYQFESKTGLLDALYDHIARRGGLVNLPAVFQRGNDPLQTLHEFIGVFLIFWASDQHVIRRLHALAAIDGEIGRSLQERNERRRKGLRVILERYARVYQESNAVQPINVDMLHMLTSFETYDALKGSGRPFEEVSEIILKMADRAIGAVTGDSV